MKPGETGLPIESSETQITLYTALYQQLVEARVELEGERARLDKLRETIEQARGELEVAEAKLAQSMERRQVELLMEGVSEGYLLAHTNYTNAERAQALDFSYLTAVGNPVPPETPIKPRTMLNTAIAGVLGVFVGVGLALFLEYFESYKTRQSSMGLTR
ncbi:MAG: hypothetical protein GX030_08320 [Firmicutes bacterium]|nr:hypothetical protein [Bacillota bacterium]